jgi:hypothetical protein
LIHSRPLRSRWSRFRRRSHNHRRQIGLGSPYDRRRRRKVGGCLRGCRRRRRNPGGRPRRSCRHRELAAAARTSNHLPGQPGIALDGLAAVGTKYVVHATPFTQYSDRNSAQAGPTSCFVFSPPQPLGGARFPFFV